MFARNVSLRLKANQSVKVAQLFEIEVALFRQQLGFRDAMVLGYAGEMQGRQQACGGTKVQADTYNTSGFPSVPKIIDPSLMVFRRCALRT